MRATWLLSAIVIAGCYDPAVRDCTITCAAAGDCAAGQVCGGDKLCAAPDVAGTCRTRGGADAHVPPDAARAQLHLMVQGPGTLADSGGTRVCTDDCTFDVTPGESVTLIATPLDHKDLDRWTTSNCTGQDPENPALTCSVTIVPPITTVGARFK